MDIVYTLLLCCTIFIGVIAIPETLLYEFRSSNLVPKGDEVSSREINLKVPIVFYGIPYRSIFINTNGILSFQTEIPNFFNIEFPLDYPIISPFYSNVDTSEVGKITYFETTDSPFISRATNTVRDVFSYAKDFKPKSVFVVTWANVGYHKNGVDKLNTYQVAIYSDGTDTFVEYLYPENAIQWIQGTGDESGLPDARAQAGFISPDGRFFVLPGSGTDQVRYLDKRSNMNLPGQWLFRVGDLEAEGNVEEPDKYNSQSIDNFVPTSCALATTHCHIQAKCNDYEQGFCCSCKKAFYGNGKSCIKKDAPLRVNGKVRANLNGELIDNLDLQSYVVMHDARAYTAMSRIPETIGFDIQSLQILGATIGWLFAKPSGSALNGFQLTGGFFNHSATITFPNTNQKVNIRQKYLGLDVFDQLKLDVDITGEIPDLPIDSKITIGEYQEQYTLTAPGVIQSSSTHMFKYTQLQEEIEVPYSIDQNFVFDYCKFSDDTPVGTTWKLKVGKNFISYEAREQIIRFGMSNKVGPFEDTDPCDEGRESCGPNSSCVVDDDNFRCICNPGYQQIYRENEESCVDINECTQGIHDCDFNSQCINEIGSFSCFCNSGFEGDGRTCYNAVNCDNVHCNENAECVQSGSLASCQCLAGFSGNGQTCSPMMSQSCDIANNCSPYGYCTINPEDDEYSCYCLPEYEGNGYECSPKPSTQKPPEEDYEQVTEYEEMRTHMEETTHQEDVDAPEVQCYNSSLCFCPLGYKLLSNTCKVVANLKSKDSCNVLHNCHPNGQCLFSNNRYLCMCRSGYEGDGYECSKLEISCSENTDLCDPNASCNYDLELNTSICTCVEGYQGNGLSCIAGTDGHCMSNGDCIDTEECLYSAYSLRFECLCKEGLQRDSQHQCVMVEGTCGGGKCVDNAECVYDDELQTHYCKCKKDFIGDGITECKTRPVGCNVLNNCGLHANCDYKPHKGLFECECLQGFYGDGYICHSEYNCHIEPRLCHSNASCISDGNRKYVCACKAGFEGNGTQCIQNYVKHDGNFLLVNQGVATLKIPFDATKQSHGKPIQIKYNQIAVGLTIDCLGGRVYWSDINLKAIRSSSYNGSHKEDFIKTDIGSPEGVAVDWVSRNIYWTDSRKDTIEVANIDSKLRKTLIDTNLVNPRGIAVHPQRGKIFWSDWDRTKPKIEWANADGSDREIFLQGEKIVHLPNSLTIDYDTEQLCYADAGTKQIACVDIDTRQPYVIAVNCTYPFGIAVTDQHIYWSDWILKKIERVDKYSLKRQMPLEVPLGGTGNKLYGLVAVPDNCPEQTNVCHYKNQCPTNYICLPDGRGSRKCVCGNSLDNTESSNCNEL